MTEIRVGLEDAIELAEMLTFIDDWLAGAGPAVGRSFSGFVGSDGYSIEALRADLDRFVGVLGVGGDGREQGSVFEEF
ncbi:hypothetical protein IU459_36670 [Nocardia amamiensis]|uniref:Uncharacterized protein n=1 Tax=Nocardia amamiensis TaxID=404578 RepID=A0ABS0D2D4_9NOCA|nr:hypothetical protein [Nocardia amamiensis]MBF6303001.1 hypothetical protein [Nocardia amamiensis]